jgi:hypothetical protein
LLGKLSKSVYSAFRTPFAVEKPFYNTVSPGGGGGGSKHFAASITNKL